MARLPKWGRSAWLVLGVVVLDFLWLGAMGSALKSCQRRLEDESSALFGITFGHCELNWAPFVVANVLIIGGFVAWRLSLRTCPACGTRAYKGTTVCKKCGHDFALALTGGASTSPHPEPPVAASPGPERRQATTSGAQPAATANEIHWLVRGERYLLGRTLNSPYYGIWDAEAPGPPLYKYPYTAHGKAEAEAHFASVEPRSAGLPEAPPVPPGTLTVPEVEVTGTGDTTPPV